MKNSTKITLAVATITTFIAPAAYAGNGGGFSPSVSATATAQVESPVELEQTGNGMSFGIFAVNPSAAGTIDTSGNVTGGVNLVQAGTPGAFATQGNANNNYTIVGDSTVTLSDTNKDPVMVAALTYPAGQQTLNAQGTGSFIVTGVLAVAAGQPAATYNGTYNVAVHY